MIGRFSRENGVFRARLDPEYNLLLLRLVREILVVLDDPGSEAMGSMVAASTGGESTREAPKERALDHLLPTMSDDPATASKLRALTEDFLRAEKSSRLRRMAVVLEKTLDSQSEELVIDSDDVWEWMGALNDVRLGLAGELGLDTQEDANRIADLATAEPTGRRDQSAAAIYMLLTWWQDSLLLAMKSGPSAN